MPFRMGPAGWYAWPYMAHWMSGWYPQPGFPYGEPFWPWTKEDEIAFLESQAEIFEDQLAQIKKRLEELKKQQKEKK